MKKAVVASIIVIFMLLFSGCGQELKITVYNATGYSTASSGWVAINAHSESFDQWILPTTYAVSDAYCDANNSYTFTAKENDTIEIGGNGAEYTFDSTGNVIGQNPFTLPNGTKTIYGDFLSTPTWYAAVNMESIIFYKK